MFTIARNCPSCHGWKIYESRFRWFDQVLRLFLVRPVRCGECDRRFRRPWFMPGEKRTPSRNSSVHNRAVA